MQSNHFAKATLLTLLMALAFFACWEWYLRSKGIKVDYDEGKELWAFKRKQVYQDADKATVFIGASRIKYGLDISTWKRLTGEDAVQLAIDATSPLPVLHNLANDKNFRGKLIIDISEGFLFSLQQYALSRPHEFLGYYEKETYSEKVSFWLHRKLESQFVFLDKNNLSLNAFLDKLPIKRRGGVFVPPIFPMDFCRVTADRQTKMTEKFVTDSNQVKWVLNNFQSLGGLLREQPTQKTATDSILLAMKNSIDKIKARGGQVAFVRPPVSGPFREREEKMFPRDLYWNRLLGFTGITGIHFADYPALNHFNCPDFSHLAPKDAITFTENLVKILKEKGWKFSNP